MQLGAILPKCITKFWLFPINSAQKLCTPNAIHIIPGNTQINFAHYRKSGVCVAPEL